MHRNVRPINNHRMRLTCARHTGRVPMGPRTHVPPPACSAPGKAAPGRQPGVVRKLLRYLRAKSGNPGASRTPADCPTSHRHIAGGGQCQSRTREKKQPANRKLRDTKNPGPGPRPRRKNDSEEAKDLVGRRKSRSVRRCPVLPMAGRPRSRCECPGQRSPTRLGRCRTTGCLPCGETRCTDDAHTGGSRS